MFKEEISSFSELGLVSFLATRCKMVVPDGTSGNRSHNPRLTSPSPSQLSYFGSHIVPESPAINLKTLVEHHIFTK